MQVFEDFCTEIAVRASQGLPDAELRCEGDAAVQQAAPQDRVYRLPMSKSLDDDTGFEENLQREGGKCRAFNVSDAYEWRQKSSVYFRNRRATCMLARSSYGTPTSRLRLGLGLIPKRSGSGWRTRRNMVFG
jgi:hypothetical protein